MHFLTRGIAARLVRDLVSRKLPAVRLDLVELHVLRRLLHIWTTGPQGRFPSQHGMLRALSAVTTKFRVQKRP
jgi:hypothetical protein